MASRRLLASFTQLMFDSLPLEDSSSLKFPSSNPLCHDCASHCYAFTSQLVHFPVVSFVHADMSQYQDTNPHFTWPLDSQVQPHQPSRRHHEQQQDRKHELDFPLDDGRRTLPSSPQSLPRGQTPPLRRLPQVQDERDPSQNHDYDSRMYGGRSKRQHKSSKPSQQKVQSGKSPPYEDQQQSPKGAPTQLPGQQLSPLPPQRRQRHGHEQDDHPGYVRTPAPQKTKLLTWCLAAFCAIFSIIIIVGGLVVLIVYLVFRPHIPRFDIPSATLNAAYLDMDYYLNADLTMLANFTNPNRKVSVDFSSVIFELYYGGSPIATRYIPPFSTPRATNMFANVEFISSQVRLPLKESQRLQQELASNQPVVFDVRGVFRARSNLGTFLRYSYWLYAHCTIATSGPPSGVMRGSKCRTKR